MNLEWNQFNKNYILVQIIRKLVYSEDLNSKLVWISDLGYLFAHQMVCYSCSVATLHTVFPDSGTFAFVPVFTPPFEYWSTIQMPGTKVPANTRLKKRSKSLSNHFQFD